MKKIIWIAFVAIGSFSCKQPASSPSKKSAGTWLAPIIKNSDSTYEKPYYRTDFVTAVYYVNKKDSSICQVMKDSAGIIRQISMSKRGIRSFFAPYYHNEQLQEDVDFDTSGEYHGIIKKYYENGLIQGTGQYTHGIMTGIWKNYDEKGKLISTDEFDSNGQLIKSVRKN